MGLTSRKVQMAELSHQGLSQVSINTGSHHLGALLSYRLCSEKVCLAMCPVGVIFKVPAFPKQHLTEGEGSRISCGTGDIKCSP